MSDNFAKLMDEAAIARRENRLNDAERYVVQAVSLCREQDDALKLAHTVRHLGDIHQDTGRLGRAEHCYREALTHYRNHESPTPLDLANAIRPLAILADKKGDVDEAIQLWIEARDLYASVGVQAGVDECSARLAGRIP